MPDLYEQADLYCAAFDWPVDGEVDWLLETVPGARSVLEPFCGNARYGPVFAARGVRYHGFDLSEAMLARATAAAGVVTSVADARSFEIPGEPFDLARCPINSIRHLVEERDLVAHLRRVRDHLVDGGVYVVESDLMRHDGPWPRPPDDKSNWTMPRPDGSVVHATWFIERCDLDRRRVWERSRIERTAGDAVAERVETTCRMRMMTSDDWPKLAEAGGFTVECVHAHRAGGVRPRVTLSRDLENTGENYYLFLRA